jgi:UDP-N-acetylglucosamine acyltransferase
VGLRRRGFSVEAISALRRAFRVLVRGGLPLAEALRRVEEDGPLTEEVRGLVAFVRSSRRGVILQRRRGAGDDEAEP